ncbi:MAG: hypothetical protein ACYSVY_27960 [Planctomycetota bacterium]|jgi:hypothetical protein
MRLGLTLLTAGAGLGIAVISYFVLAAPLGHPGDESFSNPRVDFAPLLFVIGLVMAIASMIVYELLPEREGEPD